MNTRINALDQIEGAMRTLESYGYDVSAIWKEHHAYLAEFDTRTPSDHDAKWATRNEAPGALEDHISDGKFEVLTAAEAFQDRQFVLSAGQRDTLRERHGLTPAQTIVLSNAVTFPKTRVLASITIKSAEHIDPRRRRHVLVEAVITNPAEFFEVSAARDKEREAERAKEDVKRVKNGEQPKTAHQRALVYMT